MIGPTEHRVTQPVDASGEEWETFPCICDAGKDHVVTSVPPESE